MELGIFFFKVLTCPSKIPNRNYGAFRKPQTLGTRSCPQEKLMNASTSSASAESLPDTPDVDKANSNLIEQTIPKHSHQIENDFERIRSSVARSTSVSIDGLQGLTSELQELQTLLNSEVKRVQGEIESALSGIKIIMETIAPWTSAPFSPAPPTRGPTSSFGPRYGLKSRDQS